ncbi:MAG TPA: hypothetical protein VF319_02420 [Caldimonas sp.]
MKATLRLFALAVAALFLSAAPLDSEASPHGRGGGFSHGNHGWGHGGRFWVGPGIGFGLGLGLGLGAYYYGGPWAPGYVLTVPTPVYYDAGAVPPAPLAKAAPDPIIYPRNGQSASQTEADRQACDRWAATQPSAMADASVFHRATLACMEGRGYTVR